MRQKKEDKHPYGYKGKKRYEETMAAISMIIIIIVLAAIVYSITLAITNI
jgi:hypothetical protein